MGQHAILSRATLNSPWIVLMAEGSSPKNDYVCMTPWGYLGCTNLGEASLSVTAKFAIGPNTFSKAVRYHGLGVVYARNGSTNLVAVGGYMASVVVNQTATADANLAMSPIAGQLEGFNCSYFPLSSVAWEASSTASGAVEVVVTPWRYP